MNELNRAMQQSFIPGMQTTLAEMNEAEYCLVDFATQESISYGESFLLFRGRIFRSEENWKAWLIEQSDKQLCPHFLGEEDYINLWNKYKKTRTKALTKQQE